MTQNQPPTKRVFGKFSQSSKENSCDWVLFGKVVALQLATLLNHIPGEIPGKILQNTYFEEYMRTTSSKKLS